MKKIGNNKHIVKLDFILCVANKKRNKNCTKNYKIVFIFSKIIVDSYSLNSLEYIQVVAW